MGDLITTFHIDWKLILAQLINFAIVVFVLWRFALKPLMKNMGERSETIAKSLQQAEEVGVKLARANKEARQLINEAKQQAVLIMDQSKKQAEAKEQELLNSAKVKVEKIITDAKQRIQYEKDAMLQEAKQELAHMVVDGVQKVLSKEISESVDRKIVKNRIQQMK